MIHDLKPYPAYKQSGVPWLGDVPDYWRVERVKWHFRHSKEINVGRTKTNVLSLTLRGVVNNDPNNPEGLVPKDYATYQLFRRGDLVFKLIDLENLRTSRVGLVHEDGIMSSAYVRLIPSNQGIVRFFYHGFFDLYRRGVYNQLGAGVRSTIGPNDLLNLPIVVPPFDEQSPIVRFLDHLDRRIRRYIRAKQKLIKLLEEQKQAIIHRAVTRGLDPNVRLKPSGIVGLEQIPYDWDVIQVGRVSSVTKLTGFEYTKCWQPDGNGEIIALRGFNIKDHALDLRDVEYISASLSLNLSRSKLSIGDIVMPCTGTIGHAALIKEDNRYHINQNIAKISVSELVDADYLLWILTSPAMKVQIDFHNRSGLQPVLLIGTIRKLLMPLPPKSKQRHIASHLNEIEINFNRILALISKLIENMLELRVSLIAAVVTGKIDVREAAAQLPDEETMDLTEEDEQFKGEEPYHGLNEPTYEVFDANS